MPKLILNHCTIADVLMMPDKPGDTQRKNRKVILYVDEEDFFDMLDHVNPQNIIKYLDMRRIPHREGLTINVKETTVNLNRRNHCDRAKRGLYETNVKNRKKLNRALDLLDNLKKESKA